MDVIDLEYISTQKCYRQIQIKHFPLSSALIKLLFSDCWTLKVGQTLLVSEENKF